MSVTSLVAIYFIVWWLVFFAILPWGNRAQADVDQANMAPGTAPSAPARPRLILKALITAVIAAGIVFVVNIAMTSGLTLDDIPLPNPLDHTVETG